MAKTLRTSPPSSSIARLLDPLAASRAIEKVSGYPPQGLTAEPPAAPLQSPAGVGDPGARPIKREVVLTPETDAILDELVEAFRRATRTRLTTSHVVRAMLLSAHHAGAAIQDHLYQAGYVRLPSNARNHAAERQRFELLLARAFAVAMRQGRPVEPPA